MGASYAFSPIGWQGIPAASAIPKTADSAHREVSRDIGQFRVAALWQFGGYSLNNAATGSYQFQVGGTLPIWPAARFRSTQLAVMVQNAVSIALAGNTLPACCRRLSRTLSDDSSVMLVGKYSRGRLSCCRIRIHSIRAPQQSFCPGAGFNDISGDFVCAGCRAINNTNINSALSTLGQVIPCILDWSEIRHH